MNAMATVSRFHGTGGGLKPRKEESALIGRGHGERTTIHPTKPHRRTSRNHEFIPCLASHYIALHRTTLHCITLHCIALHYIALHRLYKGLKRHLLLLSVAGLVGAAQSAKRRDLEDSPDSDHCTPGTRPRSVSGRAGRERRMMREPGRAVDGCLGLGAFGARSHQFRSVGLSLGASYGLLGRVESAEDHEQATNEGKSIHE